MLNPNEPASDRPNSSEIPMDEFEHCRIVGVVRRKLALEKLYDIPSQLTYLDHHGRSIFHGEDIQHWMWDHRDEIAASAWDDYYPGFGPQKPAGDRRGSECWEECCASGESTSCESAVVVMRSVIERV